MHAKPSAAQQSRRPAAIMPACPDRRMDCVQQMVLNDEVAALRSRCTDYGPTPDGVEDIGLVQLAAAYGYADMLALLLEYRTDTRTDMAMAVFDAPLRLVCNTSYTPPDTPATCRRGGSGGSGGGGGGGDMEPHMDEDMEVRNNFGTNMGIDGVHTCTCICPSLSRPTLPVRSTL